MGALEKRSEDRHKPAEPLPGKIFLNEQRGILETAMFRRLMTFNEGDFYDINKASFKSLIRLNQETLIQNGKLDLAADEAVHLIVLPITGDLYFTGRDDHSSDISASEINVSEAKVCCLTPGSRYSIANPYELENVDFLQIMIRDITVSKNSFLNPIAFDLTGNRNRLTEVYKLNKPAASHFSLSIGQFDGRSEICYQLQQKGAALFLFVISGAFEIEGRLLETGDALALWDLEQAEIEALSNYATLIVLEL
ncbi:pirin family protein [Pedobacter metabolipauper]|uniref:Quercetin 2,3-dioxygenase C-terminal cupin domain-containing protein n=1 Tax=Pedobacter metabolipauper TaxID=425513 RepID=A0A4R6SRJ1_9SPHI|nr:hypothetical protein [Pedobacter metabolipauper]TDQ06977.1 hypothetical protein ATK78_3993 [Pedobacter metabolipauper]